MASCKHVRVAEGDGREIRLRCGNQAQDGSDYCYPHDPARRADRQRAAAQASVRMSRLARERAAS